MRSSAVMDFDSEDELRSPGQITWPAGQISSQSTLNSKRFGVVALSVSTEAMETWFVQGEW